MRIPLIIGGPSGVGKSSFGEFLKSEGWVYLEADQYPIDGIDKLELRAAWDQFWNCRDARALANDLKARKSGTRSAGIVLSLPGCAIPSVDHLRAANGQLLIRFLYGEPQFCLAGFLERERVTGRNLQASHWEDNNMKVFMTLCTSDYQPYLVNVFHPDGKRIAWKKIMASITSNKRAV